MTVALERTRVDGQTVDAHRPTVRLRGDEGHFLEASLGEPLPDGRGEIGGFSVPGPDHLGPGRAELGSRLDG